MCKWPFDSYTMSKAQGLFGSCIRILGLCLLIGPGALLGAQMLTFPVVFEQHSVVMLLIDPGSGQIVDANPAAEAFYGHARAELNTMRIQQINTLTPEQVAAELNQAQQEGRNYFIFRHRLASDEIRTVEVHSHPYQAADGRKLLLSIIHDITPGRKLEQGLWHYQQQLEDLVAARTAALEARNHGMLAVAFVSALIAIALIFSTLRRKRVEAALAYRHGMFASLFEQSGLLACVLDQQGCLREVNQRAAQYIGQPAQEIVGRAFIDLPCWRDADKLLARKMLDRVRDGQADNFEANLDGAEGKQIAVLFNAVPVIIGRDNYISVFGIDISELKRLAEQELQSSRLLGAVFDQTAIGLALVAPNGQFLKINDQFATILGYEPHELRVPGADFQQITCPEDLATDLAWVHRLLAGEADHYSMEKRYVHKKGHHIWASLHVRLLRDQAGRPTYFISAITDIDERKALESALQASLSQAEKYAAKAGAASQAKNRFLATMSHEIRTPLNGVLGMAQLLQDTRLSEAERCDCARTILNSGKVLLTLLNDILDLSKVEAGKLALEFDVVDIQHLLRDTEALFMTGAKAKGLGLETFWVGPAHAYYRSDPSRLRQMLANLVNNAIKFTAQGKIQLLASEVDSNGSAALLEFAVVDTGIGIAAEQQELLFEPFSQIDNSTSRRFGGSGLGLSIVRSLAYLLGGDVGVDSVPGQGSRFWFRIRADRLTAEEAGRLARDDAPAINNMAHAQLHGHVLVVEDNATNCLILETLLPMLGLTFALAADGQEAVEYIIERGEPVDAILMDLQMPIMDGYAATERIRQWEAANDRLQIPIIAVSAGVFPEFRERCLALGMNDFIAKPIMLDELQRALERWLDGGAAAPAVDDHDDWAGIRAREASREVDVARFQSRLGDLLLMLEQGNFDALNAYVELEVLAAGTPAAETLQEGRKFLELFQFDQVLPILIPLRQSGLGSAQ